MTSPLAPTIGMLFLALFLQSILYGMGLLQAWLYFFWYQKDGWFIKLSVVLITLCETAETALFFCAAYVYLIDGFGDTENLTKWNLPIRLALVTTYMTILVAQIYFAHCIYRLHQEDKIIPLLILIFAFACFGSGMGQVVTVFKIQGFKELDQTVITRTLQAVFALVADILITVALCWRLSSNKGGLQSTNKLLNYLIITAINRGVLTMISAGLNLILFSTNPGTFYFMLWVVLGGKFYMNSMLATLNTRGYAVGMLGENNTINLSTIHLANHHQSGGGGSNTIHDQQNPIDDHKVHW